MGRATPSTTTAAGQPASSSHVPALDGIRGLAVLSVMTYHFFLFGEMVPGATPDRVIAAVASAGWMGVDLFFVLSGFLITGILLDSRGGPGYFRTFYARRVLRIFPLYYGVLALFFIALPLAFPGSEVIRANTRDPLWSWSYLTNVQTAVYGWSSTSLFLDHFWSLAVEEQFYLVWPFLVFFLSRPALVRLCGAIVAGSLLVRGWLYWQGFATAAFVLTPARMDTLAIGAMVAIAARDPATFQRVRRGALPSLAASAAILAGVCLWRGGLDKSDAVVGTIGFTILAIGFACLLVVGIIAPAGSPLFRFLTARPLRSMGKYSYALYVFHQPIALVLPLVGLSGATLLPAFSSRLPGQLVYTVVAFTITVGAALVSWNLYEKHFLRLKAYFEYPTPGAMAARDGSTGVVGAAEKHSLIGARAGLSVPEGTTAAVTS